MSFQLLDAVTKVGWIFLLVIFALWSWHYSKLTPALRIFGLYLTLNLLIQVLANYLWSRSMNNLWLLHINTCLEFVCYTLFFKYTYFKIEFFKRFSMPWLLVGILLLLLNGLFWEHFLTPSSIAKSLVQIVIISYSILYFFDVFGQVDLNINPNRAILLITFVTLFNYAGSLFIFMYSQFVDADNIAAYNWLWLLNGCIILLFQFIIMLAYIGVIRDLPKPSP